MSETQTPSPAETAQPTQTTTPAPARRGTGRAVKAAAKTGNPQTDRDVRDAASARDASVIAGVSSPAPSASGKTTPKPVARTGAQPKPAPKPASAPKPTGPTAKNEMARTMIQAVADSLKGQPADVKQAAANMCHHFPTGKTPGGARWWPSNLPKPARSDWA